MKGKVIDLFEADKTLDSVNEILEVAVKDAKDSVIVNCMIVMVDDNDSITYSYANFYRKITMVGALEKLKHIYLEADSE